MAWQQDWPGEWRRAACLAASRWRGWGKGGGLVVSSVESAATAKGAAFVRHGAWTAPSFRQPHRPDFTPHFQVPASGLSLHYYTLFDHTTNYQQLTLLLVRQTRALAASTSHSVSRRANAAASSPRTVLRLTPPHARPLSLSLLPLLPTFTSFSLIPFLHAFPLRH